MIIVQFNSNIENMQEIRSWIEDTYGFEMIKMTEYEYLIKEVSTELIRILDELMCTYHVLGYKKLS